LVHDAEILAIKLDLLDDDLCSISAVHLEARKDAYIGCKCKAEGYIAADVDTAMFFHVPTALCKPESCPSTPGEFCLRRVSLDRSIDRSFFGVAVSFKELVPKQTERMDE